MNRDMRIQINRLIRKKMNKITTEKILNKFNRSQRVKKINNTNLVLNIIENLN